MNRRSKMPGITVIASISKDNFKQKLKDQVNSLSKRHNQFSNSMNSFAGIVNLETAAVELVEINSWLQEKDQVLALKAVKGDKNWVGFHICQMSRDTEERYIAPYKEEDQLSAEMQAKYQTALQVISDVVNENIQAECARHNAALDEIVSRCSKRN